jgi:predicted nucleic acid-binding protein
MKISQYIAFLDTCVLAPMPVMDTLLRLAEEPAFYTPKWSSHVIQELEKTLKDKFRYSPKQVQRRIQEMEAAFPSAMVAGYENLIDSMENDPKDRHVLAAAIKCGAHAIVSDNVKHFPPESLAPYNVECMSADKFIEHQYHLNPDAFIGVLAEQAREIEWTVPQLISKHVRHCQDLLKSVKTAKRSPVQQRGLLYFAPSVGSLRGLPPALFFRIPAILRKYSGPRLAVAFPPLAPRTAAGSTVSR